MAEQTAGLEVDELLSPEDYLQEYKDTGSREEDLEEMEVDELTEEETGEGTLESDKGSDYDDDDDDDENGKGKGKAREKVNKPAKSAKGKKSKSKKPKLAKQVLNELIGHSYFCLRF